MFFIFCLLGAILSKSQLSFQIIPVIKPFSSYEVYVKSAEICGQIITINDFNIDDFVFLLKINNTDNAGVYVVEEDIAGIKIDQEYILYKNGDLLKYDESIEQPSNFLVSTFSPVDTECIIQKCYAK